MKLEPIPRGSLTARVTERLRSAILDGELELGDALSEDKLAKTLGVSRSPVREALAALEQQGLIDVRPQRGSFVFLPSQEDTKNLCEFRRAIELEALRLAMQRQPENTVAALREAAEDMQVATGEGDGLRSARADDRFHDTALANSGNPYLVNAYRLVSGKVAALRAHRSALPTRKQANAEHFAIVAMLEGGDVDGALRELSVHIIKMAERYALNLDTPQSRLNRRSARSASIEHLGPLVD
ncbi:GntR family transcriptional regulator [Rhizobiaceae bacterium BDR2-2]|uniref:GntR family transcriptional regulator n=1 Tax=Ectorhizobium quercum TaxID=2965071 RepID=A0AAE3MZH7_9HYPH|nr:GntR family transcriptional regulator [Ectorhizobium quercum]MCX8998178.1 GntR family transcriptional regulator [Ectorhizobium quercum]